MLSLIIGHFLAEPLNVLVKKTEAVRSGADVSLAPDGRLHEADELSKTIDSLVKKTKSQQIDLALKERRQSAFVSDVAHELRTPLTAIRGNAEMLSDPDLPPELHDKFCSIIVGESERLSRLTNDLLALQRIENDHTPFELQRVNLKGLAHSVIDALEPILRDREANTEIVGEAPDVLGNPDRLKQAVTNLVENASRFIDPGGHITIELFGLRGNSILAVKDDGPGVRRRRPQAVVRPLLPRRRLAQPRHGRHGAGAGHREIGGGGARRHGRGHQPARGRRLLHRGAAVHPGGGSPGESLGTPVAPLRNGVGTNVALGHGLRLPSQRFAYNGTTRRRRRRPMQRFRGRQRTDRK